MTDVARPVTAAPKTLTFLFADLRDYTRFVEQYGDAAATMLIGDYRRIVRGEVAKAGGAEVKTEGDSFYVVFPSARAAVSTAIAILREAERYSRDRPDRAMKVGIGIHAGEPTPHEGQYVGAAVIVAARLAQSATAGELLVSDVVRALIPRETAPPMSQREGLLLKGIERPPRAFSVSWQSMAAEPRAPAGGDVVAIEAAPPSKRILCPELIGREAQLAELDSALRDVTAGAGRTVLVAGDAGLGKSALLKTFAEKARAQGVRVLLGECTEVEARRPFGPFVDALSAAGLPLPQELAQGGPGALPIAEIERYRVHAGFARVLSETATNVPVVMAIEDLHWADEATLELVPYLARKLRDQRVLLLGTYRSDELHRLHPLNHLLAELSRGRLGEEVRLGRLSEDETAAVIRGALGLGRAPTSRFRQAIYERCEGNPFFVEEVLRALVERGDLAYREGAWRRTKEVEDLAIPVSIRDAVQQRLKALAADARRAMQIAAVIGQRFDFELLQRVSGMEEPKVLDALRAAIDEQLIEEEGGDDQETYRFRHALTRESVLAELLQRERRMLHRSVGEAIEARARTDLDRWSEELAYHFDEARDPERAFRYHELAARQARTALAFSREVRHLERAVELAPDEEPGLPALYLRLSDAALQAADPARAARAAEEGRTVSTSRGDRPALGGALWRLSIARWLTGATAEAHALAEEAVITLEPLGPSTELASAYGELSRLSMLAQRNDEAIAWGEKALSMAREIGAVDVEVAALNNVGVAKVNEGDPAGLELQKRGLRLALEHDLIWHAQRAYQNLFASSGSLVGVTAAEARRYHEEGVALARRYGIRPDFMLAREGYYAFDDGDWDRVLAVADEISRESIWAASQDMMKAVILTAREGPASGLPLIDAPKRRLLEARDPQWLANAMREVEARYVAGDLEGAIAAGELAVPLVEVESRFPIAHGATVIALGAARQLDEPGTVERWEAILLSEKEGPVRFTAPRHAFAEAIRNWRHGDRGGARRLLDEALEDLEDIRWSSPVPPAVMQLALVELLLEEGARDEAQRRFDELVPFWRKAKATWYLGRLAEWARERGLVVTTET